MTDKEYLEKMHAFMRELSRLDPHDQDDAWSRDNIFSAVRLLNLDWQYSRRWRHWHYILNLLILAAMLAFVVFTIVC